MSTNKRIGVAVGVLAALALGFWVFTQSHFSSWISDMRGSEQVLPHEVTAEGDRHYAQENEFFDISFVYPNATPLKESADKRADRAAIAHMEAWVKSQADDFIAMGDFEDLTEADKEMIGFASGRKYTLEGRYEKAESEAVLSYVFNVYIDTLGAHPNSYYKTFMFDKKDGRFLLTRDLFSGDWLSEVAKMSKEQVTSHLREVYQAEPTLFEEGFAPIEDNFANAYIDKGELVILFSPYQVAAYAAGPQEARIPLSEIADILLPQYR